MGRQVRKVAGSQPLEHGDQGFWFFRGLKGVGIRFKFIPAA